MKTSKLISLLKSFSNEEMKRFGKFVDSPYFNEGRNFKPLYTILKKYHPDYSVTGLSEEMIFSKLYRGEKYDRKKASQTMRVLFSGMTKLARKFIVYDKLEQNEAVNEFNNFLAQSLLERNHVKLSHDILSGNLEMLKMSVKNRFFYINELETGRLMTNVLSEMKREAEGAVYDKTKLLYLYAFIFETMAGYLNDSFARKYNYNIEFKGFELVKSFVENFNPELFDAECADDEFKSKDRILFNYNLICSRIDENNQKPLLTALSLYYGFCSQISDDLKRVYFGMLFNRLIGRMHLNNIYSVKMSELIDFYINNEIWKEKNNPYLGIRIYDIGLNIKIYLYGAKAAKKYINSAVDRLSPVYKNDFKIYSNAFVCFVEKDFEKCIELISKKDSLNNFFKLTTYRLRICSLYELKQYEDALYAADAFERFVKRKKDFGLVLKKSGTDFSTAIRNLVKLKLEGNDASDLVIRKIKKSSKVTFFGDWINEKIAELESV